MGDDGGEQRLDDDRGVFGDGEAEHREELGWVVDPVELVEADVAGVEHGDQIGLFGLGAETIRFLGLQLSLLLQKPRLLGLPLLLIGRKLGMSVSTVLPARA